MREIRVYPLPSMAEQSFVENGVAVVIDVLRATSVVAFAMDSGVKEIVPVLDVDEAIRLKREIETNSPGTVLLGGERKGLLIEGFDLGNSPQDYTPGKVAGKTLVFTTTNGTVAMHAARSAKEIYMACFLNAEAVVEKITMENRIAVFCAGTCGVETEEDFLLAGRLVFRLCRNGTVLNSSAKKALKTWKDAGIASETMLAEVLRKSRGGRNLAGIGLDTDIEAAARWDSLSVTPRLDPVTMRIHS